PAAEGEGTLPASVDALLLEILDAEVTGHLATVEDWLVQARSAPMPATDALMRAMHTMNGAFAMTEVPAITDALSPAEAYVRRLLASRGEAGDDAVAALGELAGLIRSTVAALHAPAPQVPVCAALAARLAALRDSLPEAAAPVETPAIPESIEPEPEDGIDAGAQLTANDLSAYGDLAQPAEPADDAARIEAERIEAQRLEAERLEAERAEAERLEAERAEAERLEAERLEAERAEAERLARERMEQDRAVAAASTAMLAAIPADEDPDAEFDFTGLDSELVEIFVEEGRDLLDHSDSLLANLRESADDRESLVGLQRDLHTLKGGARMAG